MFCARARAEAAKPGVQARAGWAASSAPAAARSSAAPAQVPTAARRRAPRSGFCCCSSRAGARDPGRAALEAIDRRRQPRSRRWLVSSHSLAPPDRAPTRRRARGGARGARARSRGAPARKSLVQGRLASVAHGRATCSIGRRAHPARQVRACHDPPSTTAREPSTNPQPDAHAPQSLGCRVRHRPVRVVPGLIAIEPIYGELDAEGDIALTNAGSTVVDNRSPTSASRQRPSPGVRADFTASRT